MTMIKLNNITHSYGAKPVLHDLTLNIEANQLTCLLGGSGCGKTTILRLIAGLEFPQAGQITIEDKIVTENEQILIPPHLRNIGFIFQDLALWPHFTIFKNISFGKIYNHESSVILSVRMGIPLFKRIEIPPYMSPSPSNPRNVF